MKLKFHNPWFKLIPSLNASCYQMSDENIREKYSILNGRSSRNQPYNEEFLRRAFTQLGNARSRSVSSCRERNVSSCNSRLSSSKREMTQQTIPDTKPVKEIITKKGSLFIPNYNYNFSFE